MPPPGVGAPVFGPAAEEAPEMAYQNDPQLGPGRPYYGYEPSADLEVAAENTAPTLEASYQYEPRAVDDSPALEQTSSAALGFVLAPAPDSYQGAPSDLSPMPGPLESESTLPSSGLVQEPGPQPLPLEGNVEENETLPILQGGKPPLPLQTGVHSAPLLENGHTNAAVAIKPSSFAADPKPGASATNISGLAKGVLLPMAHLEAKISEAVGTLRSAVVRAASSIGALLAALFADHSTEPSSATTTGGDSGGTSQQPPPPSAPPPPVEGSSFSLSGGGQIGAGGGTPLLLLGALALGLVLPRRDGRLLKAFCEAPRLCSVLLLPLERPG